MVTQFSEHPLNRSKKIFEYAFGEAAKNGHLPIMKDIFEKTISKAIKKSMVEGFHGGLTKAIYAGQLDALKYLRDCESCPENVFIEKCINRPRDSLLYISVEYGHSSITDYFVREFSPDGYLRLFLHALKYVNKLPMLNKMIELKPTSLNMQAIIEANNYGLFLNALRSRARDLLEFLIDNVELSKLQVMIKTNDYACMRIIDGQLGSDINLFHYLISHISPQDMSNLGRSAGYKALLKMHPHPSYWVTDIIPISLKDLITPFTLYTTKFQLSCNSLKVKYNLTCLSGGYIIWIISTS